MANSIKFDPESIGIALFTLLSTASYPFQVKDRIGAIYSEVTPADQPYMGLIETSITGVQNTALGEEKWRITFAVLIYIRADADPATIPVTNVNAAIKAIAEVINNVPLGEKQTLGGLVNNCWIDGTMRIDTGIIDQQMAVWIPVTCEVGV